jgi:hypothetical protein
MNNENNAVNTDNSGNAPVNEFQAALKNIQEARAYLSGHLTYDMPPDEFRRLMKVGRIRSAYLQEGYNHSSVYGDFLPQWESQSVVNGDYNNRESLELICNELETFLQEALKTVCGMSTRLYKVYRIYEDNAAAAGKLGNAAAEEIARQMKAKRPSKGRPKAKPPEHNDTGVQTGN